MKTSYKLTEEQKNKMLSLYEEGKMDSEIATELGNITAGAVFYWRKKLGLKSKFSYAKISKINAQKCKELFDQNLSDYKIADILGVSPDGVYSHRKRFGLIRNKSLSEGTEIQLTKTQKEVLIGTLLGDSSLSIGKNCKNPRFSCAHCVNQKEYAEYKASIFSNLNSQCKYSRRNIPDKRNGKYYEEYEIRIPSNPAFLPFYSSFYINGRKHIPFCLFDYFTERSLAFWFMDDGYRVRNIGYVLCTNSFEVEELHQMQLFLKEKFDLNTSIWKGNQIYIKKNCIDKFKTLILPYVCKSMLYKLISVS